MGATRTVVAALLVAGVAGAAGCGADDRLSREEYIAAADAICVRANGEIDALAEPQSAEELVAFIRRAREIGEQQLAELRELSPPADIEARVEEAYDLVDAQLALSDELEQAAEDGDLARIEELSAEGEELNDEADAIAREVGLEACGSS